MLWDAAYVHSELFSFFFFKANSLCCMFWLTKCNVSYVTKGEIFIDRHSCIMAELWSKMFEELEKLKLLM